MFRSLSNLSSFNFCSQIFLSYFFPWTLFFHKARLALLWNSIMNIQWLRKQAISLLKKKGEIKKSTKLFFFFFFFFLQKEIKGGEKDSLTGTLQEFWNRLPLQKIPFFGGSAKWLLIDVFSSLQLFTDVLGT